MKGLILMKKSLCSLTIALILCLCFSVFCSAKVLPLNEKTIVTVETNSSVSYDITIEEKGFFYLDIFIKSIPENLRISYSIKDGEDVLFSYNLTSRDDNEKDFGEGLLPGTYTLTINSRTVVPVDVNLTTEFTPTDYCETVSNNSFETAIPVEFGKSYVGATSINTDPDYYCFTMFEKGYVEIEAENWVDFTLCDDEFNELCSGGGSSQNEDPRIMTSGLLPGRVYYLKVSKDGSEKGFGDVLYRFNVKQFASDLENFETECNNSTETATEIEPGIWYSGYVFGETDADYYYFDLAYPDKIDFKLEKDLLKGMKVYFWNGESDEPDNKETTMTGDREESKIEAKLMPSVSGKYYIKICSHPFSNQQNAFYKFRIKGEALDYMIHPDTKKIILKEDYYKESGAEEEEAKDPSVSEDISDKDEEAVQFDDIPKTSWYHDDILEARELGLIEGVDKNNYAPKDTITVAQAITMAVRFHKDKNGIDFSFGRFDGDNWYDSYLIYAKNAGLIKEDDFTEKQLSHSATRAEMAYIFASVLSEPDGDLFKSIPDVNDDTPYADSIRKLYTLGVLKGNDKEGTFSPDTSISRAEAAVIILRASKI